MRLDPAASRSVVWQDQQARHGGYAPATLPSHVPPQAALAVEADEHGLEVWNYGLDLDNEQRAGLWMDSEHVDRTSLTPDVERGLRRHDPAVRLQDRHDMFHETSVAPIQESIETFAVPEKAEVQPGPEGGGDAFERVHGHAISLPALDAPDDCAGHSDPCRQICLCQATPETKRPEPESETDDVHAASIARAAAPAVDTAGASSTFLVVTEPAARLLSVARTRSWS